MVQAVPPSVVNSIFPKADLTEETEEMASVFLPSDDDECFPNMSDVGGGGGGGRGSRAEDVGVLLR